MIIIYFLYWNFDEKICFAVFFFMSEIQVKKAQINFSSQNRYRVHYLEICRRIVKEGKRVFLYWVENILLSP